MDRTERCELLAQLHDSQLRQLVDELGDVETTIVTEPTVGMLMMRVREDALGDTFHLGEVLVTECLVRVADQEGWAMLMGSRSDGARLAATIDAAIAAFPEREASLETSLADFSATLQAAQAAHHARLAPTRVRFETQ